ncbi:dihydroorotate dehydrogenase electron transfer subunit [Falsiroseomonas selenitidurans]|uniref:Dihydroorotate dehydrogenase electron transfer subunit n=1 Tax=Falsiroseomonas selenitidurans TaxID=2716335 RepID=A0ABX1E2Y3_9PROT|nr:dihydroorotate dehydrogenase electron transfer subunit [Falsiroseomonas selenitidurans]NKC29872.1 dihydroorotate dehydrogenase electron transfer subunit [Falsiroseomonas selenitidurans]
MDLGGFPVAEADLAVVDSAPVGRRYHRLLLDSPALSAASRPGQFFHLLCRDGGGNGPYLRRPMSIWRCGAGQRLGFLFHVKGRGTAALAALRPGDRLSAVGPLGQGFRLEPGWRRILILARGVGLATLAPLTEAAAAQGITVQALLSAQAPGDLMAAEFAGASGATVQAVFDSDGSSAVPAVEALLRATFEGPARPDAVFTCGSNRLFLLLQRLAAEYGIPGQIALEQQMGCGLGMCFCCVRQIRAADGGVVNLRVCAEGPVFDLQAALAW